MIVYIILRIFFLVCNRYNHFLKDRGIGESCFEDNQCSRVTVNSACNQTARVCQCKAGFPYLYETNSCSPGKIVLNAINFFTLIFEFKKNFVFKLRYLSRLNKEFFILNNKIKYAKFYNIMNVIFIHSEIILYTTFSPRTKLGRSVFRH